MGGGAPAVTPLTVACVLVDGPYRAYNVDYVVRLERMVRRHLARPYRFVCLTDGRKGDLPAPIETVRIPSVPGQEGYWAKVQLFNPAWGFSGRMLYLDLDTLVVRDLAPIVDFPAELALTEDALVQERAHLATDRYGRRLVRKFNSSVIVWDAGTHDALCTRWRARDAARLSTDQDWIAEQAPTAQAMPLAWFPRISHVQPPWPDDAKVVLCKKPKNHEAVVRWPALEPWWGGQPWQVSVDGIWWPEDALDAREHALRHWQSIEWALARCQHHQRTRTAVQAGGNIGLWPRRMADVFDRVITFEPEPQSRACLERNVPAHVEVRVEALGETPGMCGIGRRGLGSHRVMEGASVPVTTIDALRLDDVDLVQLDIEGYEWHALVGARATLERDHPLVQVELRGFTPRYGATDEAVREILSDLGYAEVSQQQGADVVFEWVPR
jgi:FkbM family methyltransferase